MDNQTLQQKYDAVKGDVGTTAIVKTIRQNESNFDGSPTTNPYNQSHDSGTGFGAYGFQYKTWDGLAQQYAGDKNLAKTPANQDMVAYLYANDLKNQYGKVKDVLSIWNHGQPYDTGNNPGNQAVKYDSQGKELYNTPAYVQKGIENFKNYYTQEEAKQGKLTDNTSGTPQADHGFLGNLVAGAVKPFANVATNLIHAGQDVMGTPETNPFSGQALGEVPGIGKIDMTKSPLDPENFKTIGNAVKAGVDIGSWFGGGGATEDIAKLGLKGFLKGAAWDAAKVGGTIGAMQGATTGLEPGATPGGTVVNTILGAGTGFGTGLATGPLVALGGRSLGWLTGHADEKAQQEATQTIQDMISPKLNSREARAATVENRFVPGKNSSWLHPFTSGTADSALASKEVQEATQTIQNTIPNAEKMSPSQLYNETKKVVSNVAEQNHINLQDVPVNRQTIVNMNSELESTSAKILKEADANQVPNVMKRQAQFEEILKNTKTWSMDDLWKSAMEYDRSIPDRIKNADLHNPNIPSDVIQQKTEWLARRDIFKKAINDDKNGLGELSANAFKVMKDMFNAQEGILSNVKPNLIPDPSKLGSLFKKIGPTALGIGAGELGLGGAYGIAEKLGLIPQPK